MKRVISKGVHQCICGEKSGSKDYEILPGVYTNSLAPHYLRFHRSQVPEKELMKIKMLMGECPRTDG